MKINFYINYNYKTTEMYQIKDLKILQKFNDKQFIIFIITIKKLIF